MRHRLLLYLVLCAALPFCAAACRRAQPQTGEDGLQSQKVEAIEDSGRRLAGDYFVQTLTNEYAADAVQAVPRWAFSFKEDGSFRKARDGHGATRIEEGSYLISTQGELILYIESITGEVPTDARVERYKIEAQSEGELTLRRNGSITLVLHKQ